MYPAFPFHPRDEPFKASLVQQQKLFWTAGELDLRSDRRDYERLMSDTLPNGAPKDSHAASTDKALATAMQRASDAFANLDDVVAGNLNDQFLQEIKLPCANRCGRFIAMMEGEHAEVYTRIVTVLHPDKKERERSLHSLTQIPEVKEFGKVANLFTDQKTRCFAERVIAFLSLEGMCFPDKFAVIFLFKRPPCTYFKNIVEANRLIFKDEDEHIKFSALLYNTLDNKLPVYHIHEIAGLFVETTTNFSRWMLEMDVPGLTRDSMSDYIQFQANRCMSLINVPFLFPRVSRCPISYMLTINDDVQINFFEALNTEYRHATAGRTVAENTLAEGDIASLLGAPTKTTKTTTTTTTVTPLPPTTSIRVEEVESPDCDICFHMGLDSCEC